MSKRADVVARILTSIARCLQQKQNLVIVEMFQGVDVIDDLWIEGALAREAR